MAGPLPLVVDPSYFTLPTSTRRAIKVLTAVDPTPEQLTVIRDYKPGVTLIRGAAGSGKTTTALLRLNFLALFWRARRARQAVTDPVRFLVLTYNKTLRGYIERLAADQVKAGADLELEITTFGKWSTNALPDRRLVASQQPRILFTRFGKGISLPEGFLCDEVDYLLGRFLPADLPTYLTCRRERRGVSPRVERPVRERLLADVVTPYSEWKEERGCADWNDLAVALAGEAHVTPYDVVIIDEAQDFSANQVRAVINHLADDHSMTFVLDSAQQIYPRHFNWREVGIEVRPNQRFHLSKNHRNTVEIAAFALPLLVGLELDDDGTLPDFDSCTAHGRTPAVVQGRFSRQMEFAIDYLRREVDLGSESVAFLHPKGGGWFDHVRERLGQASMSFVEISQRSDWPPGSTNIALSTLASAKGLEFDHVFILGLNQEVTPHGADPRDSLLDNLRRLLAMGIGRARRGVVLGYKAGEASTIIGYLDPATYEAIDL